MANHTQTHWEIPLAFQWKGEIEYKAIKVQKGHTMSHEQERSIDLCSEFVVITAMHITHGPFLLCVGFFNIYILIDLHSYEMVLQIIPLGKHVSCRFQKKSY